MLARFPGWGTAGVVARGEDAGMGEGGQGATCHGREAQGAAPHYPGGGLAESGEEVALCQVGPGAVGGVEGGEEGAWILAGEEEASQGDWARCGEAVVWGWMPMAGAGEGGAEILAQGGEGGV